MKKILLSILISVTGTTYAQEWAEYTVDENLTVTIPTDFILEDTLGQLSISAYMYNAVVKINRIENKGKMATKIHNKKKLLEAYASFEKGALSSSQGTLVERKLMEMGTFQLLHFSYVVYINGQMELRHCRMVFLNEFWYVVQFWEVQSMSKEFAPEREKLFSIHKTSQRAGVNSSV